VTVPGIHGLGGENLSSLSGQLLSTVALFFAPYSSALWMAAGALWILDASINISMEPFRALVADKLPDSQRSYGFVVQTLIIGIGTWVASNLPWMMTQLGVPNTAAEGVVPDSVKYAFGIGALVLFSSILYTIMTTDEYPPEDLEEFEREKAAKKGFFSGFGRDPVKNISRNAYCNEATRFGAVFLLVCLLYDVELCHAGYYRAYFWSHGYDFRSLQ
jgi:hypothetical protein